ncbi:MAG: hypothetical protein KatS3mg057_0966 [Herpetosiphonaceae bacterium]|nr:MAG: hypothetical protein KatS3mg057_0966 [Herpetosiphonaceae bacterium]
MMAIRVKFVGERRQPPPSHEMMVSLPKGATVADLLAMLQIMKSEELIISRNSEVINPSVTLYDGDSVLIYSLQRG